MNMKILTTFVLIAGVGIPGGYSHADTGLDSSTQSKLARLKARQKLAASQLSNEERKNLSQDGGIPGFGKPVGETPCGAIDLGNVKNGRGFRGMGKVTIIIDGDVINTGNNCR